MTEITIKVLTITEWKPINFARSMLFMMAFILPGVFLDSQAMQWTGFLIMVVVLMAAALSKSSKPMTIAEARVKLDELEFQQK